MKGKVPKAQRAVFPASMLIAIVILTVWASSLTSSSVPPTSTSIPTSTSTSMRSSVTMTSATITTMSGGWRPYSISSIWNTKIPTNPKIHPNSAAIIAAFASSAAGYPDFPPYGMLITEAQWSIPVYYADKNTPRYNVQAENAEWVNPIPIPANFQADLMSDGHAVIIDLDAGLEYDFYMATNLHPPNALSAGGVYKWPLYGNGYGNWGDPWACTAPSLPLLAGLIRPDEYEAGVITHALAFACEPALHRSGYVVYPPAFTTIAGIVTENAITYGARLQLDPSLDINSLGLNALGKIIAKCLQDYGMFFRDQGGSVQLYAENTNPSVHPPDRWAGTGIEEALLNLPRSRFRVLAEDIPGVTGVLRSYQ